MACIERQYWSARVSMDTPFCQASRISRLRFLSSSRPPFLILTGSLHHFLGAVITGFHHVPHLPSWNPYSCRKRALLLFLSKASSQVYLPFPFPALSYLQSNSGSSPRPVPSSAPALPLIHSVLPAPSSSFFACTRQNMPGTVLRNSQNPRQYRLFPDPIARHAPSGFHTMCFHLNQRLKHHTGSGPR